MPVSAILLTTTETLMAMTTRIMLKAPSDSVTAKTIVREILPLSE
jgi:hypothetical protein